MKALSAAKSAFVVATNAVNQVQPETAPPEAYTLTLEPIPEPIFAPQQAAEVLALQPVVTRGVDGDKRRDLALQITMTNGFIAPDTLPALASVSRSIRAQAQKDPHFNGPRIQALKAVHAYLRARAITQELERDVHDAYKAANRAYNVRVHPLALVLNIPTLFIPAVVSEVRARRSLDQVIEFQAAYKRSHALTNSQTPAEAAMALLLPTTTHPRLLQYKQAMEVLDRLDLGVPLTAEDESVLNSCLRNPNNFSEDDTASMRREVWKNAAHLADHIGLAKAF
ncbi:MAG: hypothetical protein H7255_15555 [Ramlibacter sp.]|nr:hypothetical protein [Ramlibacter sp.]